MRREGEEVHLKTNEARAGRTPHFVRWALALGMIILVAIYLAIYAFGTDEAQEDRIEAKAAASQAS